MRRDALLAAAQAALAFRYIGNAYTQGDTYAYCTVGSVQVSPGVVTIFPGTCRISLDQRHIDRGILEEIYNEAHDAAEIAKILPSVMMFVRSIEGLSHCKEENTSDIDLEIGIAAFLRLDDKVIQGETVC